MAKPNNQSFMLPLLKFLGVLLLVSPFACAQTPSGQNVNGSWTATFADSTGSGTLSLTVIQTESGMFQEPTRLRWVAPGLLMERFRVTSLTSLSPRA